MTGASQDMLARFREDFCKLSGNSPFPWQERLFERFCKAGLPLAIDLPTGLGKTSVMAIWLLARAHADEAARSEIPRRLVYVVDRRAVVDQATAEAENIRKKLEDAPVLKHSLRLGEKGVLPISTLRGQYADNRDWLTDPTVPAIIVGTVDMVGSRLLFSGYGVSSKMRPYHAGLIGADTLVVLDEAHLVPPFESLIKTVAGGEFGPRATEDQKLIPRFRLMSLSATGRTSSETSGEEIFRLNAEDQDNEIVKTRLRAPKHLRIDVVADSKALTTKLAERAWKLGTEPRPARILVYCDSRQRALEVKKAIGKLAKSAKIESELLVGARRAYEREKLLSWLQAHGFVGKAEDGVKNKQAEPAAPTFLIATSAGEVGIDLDADHMVCDLVEWERMVQRFGRVNRGGRKQSILEVIAAPPKVKRKDEEDWESRFARLRAPLDMLQGSASPGTIVTLNERAENDPGLRKKIADASTAPPLRPMANRALIDVWSMTSLERHMGRPDIEPWLRGWSVDDLPKTQIVWRRHLPVRIDVARSTEKNNEEANEFFEAAPPHVSEVLEIEIPFACNWLIARAQTITKTAARYAPDQKNTVVMVLDRKGELVRSFSTCEELASLGQKENARGKVEFERLLAGATLVVSAKFGGLSHDGMLDQDEEGIPRTIDDGMQWLPIEKGNGDPTVRFRVRINASLKEVNESWRRIHAFAMKFSGDGEVVEEWLIVEQWRNDALKEDGRAIANANQALSDHQKETERIARRIVAGLGLPPSYASAIAIAALLHDEGKASWRWQRAFNAPRDKFYAKTKGPLNAKLLDGYRHEFTSLWKVREDSTFGQLDSEMQDLVLHLIAAHHGLARPIITTRNCDEEGREEMAREIAFRFARQQRRWGPWGLAWWESLLRAADQQASRAIYGEEGFEAGRKSDTLSGVA